MISLIIPAFSAGDDLRRTVDSVKGTCDDVVIVSTAMFPRDEDEMNAIASRVIHLPWNYCYLRGFGDLYNQGSDAAKNDWLMLLGVAETFAEAYVDLKAELPKLEPSNVLRCNHVNDVHTWKRIWNRRGGTHWSGIIHEEIVGGHDAGLAFRMADTDKADRDPFEVEVLRHVKGTLYNSLYNQLLQKPELLGGTNPGWLNFVRGAKESIEDYCIKNGDLIFCACTGDKRGFMNGVRKRMQAGQQPEKINFARTGESISGSV